MRYISSSAVLSHLLSHNMMAHNGPSRSFRYTNRWWDAKLEESDSTELRSWWWYPWQQNFSNFFFFLKGQKQNRSYWRIIFLPRISDLLEAYSIFLEVASEGVWGRLVTDPKGRWQRWRGSSHSCSRIIMTGKRGWWTHWHFFASLTDLCKDEVRISTTH